MSLPVEDYHYFQLYALVAWNLIWWTRNQIVHKVAALDLMELVNRIQRVTREHLLSWKQKQEQALSSRWTPPPMDTVKVNFDVAVRDTFAVGAAVIKDHAGMVVGAVEKKLPLVDLEDGEIWAAQIGLVEACRCGFQKILVKGHSTSAIDAIRSYPKRLNWRSYGRIGDMVNFFSSFDSVGFCFVNQGANEKRTTLLDGLPLRLCLEATPMFTSTFLS